MDEILVGEKIEAVKNTAVFSVAGDFEIKVLKGGVVEVVGRHKDYLTVEYSGVLGRVVFNLDDFIIEQNFRRVKDGGVAKRDKKSVFLKGTEANDGQWTFTEDEKVILRSLSKEYKWIARDRNNGLYVYEGKPHKNTYTWHGEGIKDLHGWCFLFGAIKWNDEEPCEFRKYI